VKGYDRTSRPWRAVELIRRARVSVVTVTLATASLSQSVAGQVPTLADSLTIARLRPIVSAHPAVIARRAELEAARARARLAGAGPISTLDAEIEEVPSGVDLGRAGSIRVGLSREFVAGRLTRARRRIASSEMERARLQLELAERAMLATVDRLVAHAVAGQGIARRLAAEDSLLGAAEEALRTRFATGDARYVDVLRLRSERLRAQSERAAAVAEARVDRRALLALLSAGDTSDAVPALVDSLLATEASGVSLPPAPNADTLVRIAGELRLATLELSRSEASEALVRASQRPAITAGVGAQRFEAGDDDYEIGLTIGASMTLPFTARRANASARDAAAQETIAARARLNAADARVRAEIASALDRYEAAREQLALFDAALLRTAREEREGALASYRAGDFSLLELLDFERALTRVEVERLRNRMRAADALADLVAGISGIDQSHIESASERTESDR
jgi:cobalt-zinc-cadmium efflux system outer membrane protein